MNHEQFKILLNAYLDGEVTRAQKEAIEEHLKQCAECRDTLESLKKVSHAVRSLERHKYAGTVNYRPKPAADPAHSGSRLAWLPLAAGLLVTAGVSFYAGRESLNLPMAFKAKDLARERIVLVPSSEGPQANEAREVEKSQESRPMLDQVGAGGSLPKSEAQRGATPSSKPATPPPANQAPTKYEFPAPPPAPAPAVSGGSNNSYGRAIMSPAAAPSPPVEIVFYAAALAAGAAAPKGAVADEARKAGAKAMPAAGGAPAAPAAQSMSAQATPSREKEEVAADRAGRPPVVISVAAADYPEIKKILEQVFVVEETKGEAGAVRLLVKAVKPAPPTAAKALTPAKPVPAREKTNQDGD